MSKKRAATKPAKAHQRDLPRPGKQYPGVHGKIVDWAEHVFEQGMLYVAGCASWIDPTVLEPAGCARTTGIRPQRLENGRLQTTEGICGERNRLARVT